MMKRFNQPLLAWDYQWTIALTLTHPLISSPRAYYIHHNNLFLSLLLSFSPRWPEPQIRSMTTYSSCCFAAIAQLAKPVLYQDSLTMSLDTHTSTLLVSDCS